MEEDIRKIGFFISLLCLILLGILLNYLYNSYKHLKHDVDEEPKYKKILTLITYIIVIITVLNVAITLTSTILYLGALNSYSFPIGMKGLHSIQIISVFIAITLIPIDYKARWKFFPVLSNEFFGKQKWVKEVRSDIRNIILPILFLYAVLYILS